jgi:thiamine pyrophosphokinase
MKALIIADGAVPSRELLKKHSDAELVIAADGGLKTAEKYGLVPDFLIGDFDSAGESALRILNEQTTIIRLAKEKNETDGMVAVDTALGEGARHIVMLGALGKRTDHAFANLMLIKYAWDKGARLHLEDEYCEVCLATGETQITGKTGQTVSVLPFGGSATVSSDDSLHYPMDRLFMSPGDPVGISNILKGPLAHLYIEGFALIFKIKR